MLNKQAIYALLLLFFSYTLSAQIYTEKQTRHRFAQMNFGLDYYTANGGYPSYLNSEGVETKLDLDRYSTPRLMIGGTHFWGHADFVIAFPLGGKSYVKEGQEIDFFSGVETMFKYYPWRIRNNKVVPYVGVSLSGYTFRQSNTNVENELGARRIKRSFPFLGGLSFNHKSHLLEFGVSFLYDNKSDYYITESIQTNLSVPSAFFNLSYRYLLDTTVMQERDWESGKTQEITEALAAKGKLNGFFLGAGPSSAIPLKMGSYNEDERSYFDIPETDLVLDYTLGYYWYKPDINIAANYRSVKASNEAFSAKQKFKRRSVGLEITKYLGDYHGFAPFVGPILSFETLQFEEYLEDVLVHDIEESKPALGITFGWDIRPTDLETWLLRTNLRWYPRLGLDVTEDQQVSFSTLEFNFIQLVVYPGRFQFYK